MQNKWFFFGDYQGTRDKQGGSKLLTVPTAAVRTGDLSAYNIRIYDPLTGQQFANSVIPTSRLSTQGEHDDYWIFDPEVSKGPRDFDRTHIFNLVGLYQLPFGHDMKYGSGWNGATNAVLGGWQVNSVLTIQSGIPFNVSYADCGLDRDTGPCRPNLSGDAGGPQTQAQWFNAAAIGASGSAFSRPAKGTFGDIGYNALRGPGFWQLDASMFKSLGIGGGERRLEIRLEAINVLNHVNLGQPNSEIGVPGNARPDAGKITSTAYFGAAPQRMMQIGLRYIF